MIPVLPSVAYFANLLAGCHTPERPVEIAPREMAVDCAERHPVEVALNDHDPAPVPLSTVVADVLHGPTEDSVH